MDDNEMFTLTRAEWRMMFKHPAFWQDLLGKVAGFGLLVMGLVLISYLTTGFLAPPLSVLMIMGGAVMGLVILFAVTYWRAEPGDDDTCQGS